VSILLRALGITYLTSISADICRSSGEASVAGYIESAGRVELLLLAVPLFSELFELARF
jgi:stage III sporulation protein AD